MNHIDVSRLDQLAIVRLHRGKVNAIDDVVISELTELFARLENDASIGAVVLTAEGKFFSFGFDVPHFLSYSKSAFTEFLQAFTSFYAALYVFAKPVVAALNGHTIAGGCMLATACDRRLMAVGKAKIALNEITFAASVFAGSIEMLKACVGHRNAETILYSGAMYSAEEAVALGLVDRAVNADDLLDAAIEEARRLGGNNGVAFASMKKLVRGPVAEQMRLRESDSIHEFVDIWYSDATRALLEEKEIRR